MNDGSGFVKSSYPEGSVVEFAQTVDGVVNKNDGDTVYYIFNRDFLAEGGNESVAMYIGLVQIEKSLEPIAYTDIAVDLDKFMSKENSEGNMDVVAVQSLQDHNKYSALTIPVTQGELIDQNRPVLYKEHAQRYAETRKNELLGKLTSDELTPIKAKKPSP